MLLKYLIGLLLIIQVYSNEIADDDRIIAEDDTKIVFRDDDGKLVKMSKENFDFISKQYHKVHKQNKKEQIESNPKNQKEFDVIDYSFDGKDSYEKDHKKRKGEKKQKYNSELQSLNEEHPKPKEYKYKEKKASYHEKNSENYKHYDSPKKNYYRDTEVNHFDKNKHIEKDSEFIHIKNNKESIMENYQNNNEHIRRVKKDFYKDLHFIDLSIPPSHNDTVLMARYIIHQADWASVATISTHDSTRGSPFVNIFSMSDGPEDKGIGIPFFYMTPLDLSAEDLTRDNRCSLTATLAQSDYCKKQSMDPEDPRCARIILSGKLKRVKPNTPEEEFAKNAVFSRHPAMKNWPTDHNWYLAKLKIAQIVVLNYFGGAKHIDVQEYLNYGQPKPEAIN